LHKREQKSVCVVSYVRAGNRRCVIDLIGAPLRYPLPEPRFTYVAPHYVQGKDVAWSYLKRFSENIPSRKPNETELYVEFAVGRRVRIYGANNYHRMRGICLDGVVLGELADFHPAA
jgi:phage terminase large subunit